MQDLVSAITPEMVAAAFARQGSVCEVRGELHATFEHHDAPRTYRLFGNGFISCTTGLPATIVEVLSLLYVDTAGTTAIEQAVDNLLVKFRDALPERVWTPAYRHKVIREEMIFRKAVDIAMRRKPHDLPGGVSLQYGAWLSSPQQAVNLIQAAEWEELSSMLAIDRGKADTKGMKYILIAPLFADTCTLAGFLVQDSNGALVPVMRSDVAYRYAYTGFHLFHAQSTLFVCPSATAALSDQPRTAADLPESARTFVQVDPKSSAVGWLPRSCYCVSDGSMADLFTPAQLSADGVICRMTRAADADQLEWFGSVAWAGAVASAIVMKLGDERIINPAAEMLLSLIRTNTEAQRMVINGLEQLDNSRMAALVSQKFKTGTIWQSKDQCVYATPTGYVYEDPRTEALGGVKITNFIITPESVSAYEAGDKFYHCKVCIQDELRDIAIPAYAFESLKKLEAYIQTAISLSGAPTIVEPAVFEATLARPVLSWLIEKFSLMKKRSGRSFLGWDATRTHFNGVEEDVVFKPSIEHLQSFRKPLVSIGRPDSLPAEYRHVVEACAGIIARSYANSELTPVLYKNTPETRRILQRIFSLAGQHDIVRLNPNMRHGTELACFQGYPVLATGYNCHQARACKAGLILLGEEGEELSQDADDTCAPVAAAAASAVIENLPAWIIKQGGLPCVFSSEHVTSEQVVSDGAEVLKAYYAGIDGN